LAGVAHHPQHPGKDSLGVYGGNPFLPATSQFATDPFYEYIAWKGWPSAYGPGWETMAALVARLAGNGVVANVLAFKMLPGAFLCARLGLVALTLREKAPQHALASTLLLAWNPIVLFEIWGNGHNDMAMVFWMLVAALALSRRRYTLATLALVAGALVKFIPVLLIPW
jgi:alpha-1,6-mannosyltransferase